LSLEGEKEGEKKERRGKKQVFSENPCGLYLIARGERRICVYIYTYIYIYVYIYIYTQIYIYMYTYNFDRQQTHPN